MIFLFVYPICSTNMENIGYTYNIGSQSIKVEFPRVTIIIVYFRNHFVVQVIKSVYIFTTYWKRVCFIKSSIKLLYRVGIDNQDIERFFHVQIYG